MTTRTHNQHTPRHRASRRQRPRALLVLDTILGVAAKATTIAVRIIELLDHYRS